MRFVFVVLSASVMAHDHSTQCKQAVDVASLAAPIASFIECLPTGDTFNEELFDTCSAAALDSMKELDDEGIDCITHYVDGHLVKDAECLDTKGDDKKRTECIASIVDSLFDICFRA